jgi:hypothetical protein
MELGDWSRVTAGFLPVVIGGKYIQYGVWEHLRKIAEESILKEKVTGRRKLNKNKVYNLYSSDMFCIMKRRRIKRATICSTYGTAVEPR